MSKKKKPIINNNLPSFFTLLNYYELFNKTNEAKKSDKFSIEVIKSFENQIEDLLNPTNKRLVHKEKEDLKDIHINSLQNPINDQQTLIYNNNRETYLKDYFLKYEPSNEVKILYAMIMRFHKVLSYMGNSKYKNEPNKYSLENSYGFLLMQIETKILEAIAISIAKYEEEALKIPQKSPKNQQKAFTLYKYIDLFKNPIEVIFEYMNRFGDLFNNKRIKCNAPP